MCEAVNIRVFVTFLKANQNVLYGAEPFLSLFAKALKF